MWSEKNDDDSIDNNLNFSHRRIDFNYKGYALGTEYSIPPPHKQIYKLLDANLLELDNLFALPTEYTFDNNIRRINKLTYSDLLIALECKWINLSIRELVVQVSGHLKFEFHYLMCEKFIYVPQNGLSKIRTTNMKHDEFQYHTLMGGVWRREIISKKDRTAYIEKKKKNKYYKDRKIEEKIIQEDQRLAFISIFIKRYNINLALAYSLLTELKGLI